MTEKDKIRKSEELVNPSPGKINETDEKKDLDETAETKENSDEKRTTREEREEIEKKEKLASWVPKTKIGIEVKSGKEKNIDNILENKKKILEPEIVDYILHTETELLFIGQAKGKFGGGKRRAWRQTQKKTKEGNILKFSAMAVVGDKNGHVGLGYGKAKETMPAREKSIRKAKLNIIKIERGCGNFDCSCNEKHSIPFIVEGKTGSVRVKLIPAPQGTGLVAGDEAKKILRLAGIKDVYGVTRGQVRTTFNLAKAYIDALRKTREMER